MSFSLVALGLYIQASKESMINNVKENRLTLTTGFIRIFSLRNFLKIIVGVFVVRFKFKCFLKVRNGLFFVASVGVDCTAIVISLRVIRVSFYCFVKVSQCFFSLSSAFM